jgi:S-disulfanyl-L-cysteine oxidoreductase SoxD
MCTLKCLAVCAAMLIAASNAASAQPPQFGQPIAPADIAPWDISIGPDGAGLPPGRGTVAQGEIIYAAKCQACHGEKGTGRPNDSLVGGTGSLGPDKVPVKTVGSYWPYATTLFDYIRRAMPFQESQSLSSDEVYAVSAYILHLNGTVGANDVLDAQSLPRVRMPNRDGFIPFPRNPK